MIQPEIGYSFPSTPTATTGKKLNFLGWSVLLLGLYAINKTSTGHEIIYLSMILIMIFLFSHNYDRIMPRLTK